MNKFTKSAMLSFMFATAAVAEQDSEITLEQLVTNVQDDHLVCLTNEKTNEQVCEKELLAKLYALYAQTITGPKLSEMLKNEALNAPTVEEIKEEKIAELTEKAQ